jgi:hypothetical protein
MAREQSENARYMAEWRKTAEGQESMRRQRLRRDARLAAYRNLAQAFPGIFNKLYDHELRERGVSSSD